MTKPHRRYTGIVNPPTSFVEHEAAIREQAQGLAPLVEVVNVRYGYGPCAELTLDVDASEAGDSELVRFLENLRTNEATRLITIDASIQLEAAERDRLGGDLRLENWSGEPSSGA